MEERLRFVARLLDGEKMAVLCGEFGISRKTGYKLFNRYKDSGLEGLTDRSRRPYRHANQLPMQVEKLIVQLKNEKPSWVLRRFANGSGGCIQMSTARPTAPSMPCSIGTGWSGGAERRPPRPKVRACPSRANPTSCGAPTTRASLCSPTDAIAIR